MKLTENSRIGYVYGIFGYGLVYIGSTIQLICDRKSTHNSQYKSWVERGREGWKCASYDILDKGDDWELNVLEIILTDTNKTGLLEREQFWINEKKALHGKEYITNANQATQSAEDLREYKRKWAEQNRRAKGIQPKAEGFDAKKYARDWAKSKRASLTDEEREEINKKRREARQKTETTGVEGR